MQLKPVLQYFIDGVANLKSYFTSIGFKQNQSNTREALANVTRTYMTDIDLTMFIIDDVVMHGNYPVPIRIYHPSNKLNSAPVAVFIHGGGHMCGSIAVYDGIARKLCKVSQHIIIAIDYRLAPEFAYPIGLNDSKAVIENAYQLLDAHGFKYTHQDLTLIGDSGGGAFCATLTQDESFVLRNNITKQVLLYPSLDYTLSSKSIDELASGYFLEKAKVEWYITNYFQNNENYHELSPLFNPLHSNMPKTLILVASHDPLRDEGVAYHEKLLLNSTDSELYRAAGVLHAYLMLENLCKEECEKSYTKISEFLK